jgi:hypothetical protein
MSSALTHDLSGLAANGKSVLHCYALLSSFDVTDPVMRMRK